MLTSAQKIMPVIDYVSIVRSVFKDRRAMVHGTLASAIGAGSAAYKTQSMLLWGFAGLFVLIAIFRFIDMGRFPPEKLDGNDVEMAARWELRATVWAGFIAFVYGSWCFVSFVFVLDPYAEMMSMMVTTAAMIGVVTRNFGLDRLLTLQLLISCALMSLGLLLRWDVYHLILAVMLVPMVVAFRVGAKDVRNVFLSAVHGRVEASRLALELDTALSTMQHGLCMLDEQGIVSVTNGPVLQTFAGVRASGWIGKPFSEVLAELEASVALPQATLEQLSAMAGGQGQGKVLVALPGSTHLEVTVSSRLGRTVLLFEDVTERVEAAEKISFIARHDGLTSLANRGYFAEQVTKDIADRAAAAKGEQASPITLMIIDIDDFKNINDTLGHLAGDCLLVEVASRLREALPTGALIARWGGDEFVSYCTGRGSSEAVREDAQKVLAAFAAPFEIAGQSMLIAASIGVVVSEESGETLESLMTKADLALYEAKGSGKAQITFFHDDMDVQYRYRQRLKADLRECLANGGLSLAFQPVIDINTRRVVECEALARWTHPELGPIPPSLFIPLAEEIGLIAEITRFVLETAAKECALWPNDIRVAVNISAKDFRLGDVTAMVNAALEASGLDACRLELEVTETAVIEERERASEILSALAKRGIGIALDDFGTGYSSLSYLQALPFTKVKIDRSFVADIAENQRSLKLLCNVAQLGRDIDLTVTAEGVETEEQLNLIAQHTRVDYIQGYLFGVPLKSRDIQALINALSVPSPAPEMRKLG